MRYVVVLAVVFTLMLVGCGDGDDPDRPAAHLRVVTSLEIFADMTRNVGGDLVEVDALFPSGADAHTFELPPSKAADVARADVIFINGLGLEASTGDVIAENAGGPVVELSAGIEPLDDNPHLWLDVQLARRYVETMRDALIELDPEGGDTYRANADAYLEELADLDADLEAAIAAIPPEDRKLVTFHDAYPYLAARYGLELVGVVVPSPGQEPSARDVTELIDAIEAEGVLAVYKEPQFNASVLEEAASEAGVRVLDLLSDAYAEGVDSYVELMRFNLRQLQEGLGG